MTHEQIVEFAKGNHYVHQLICLKECFGRNAAVGIVLNPDPYTGTKRCKTVADLFELELCNEEFLVIDPFINNILTIQEQCHLKRGRCNVAD